jgi:hypothetical protein
VQKIKILALDISTKTGWSVAEIDDNGYKLLESGTLDQQKKPDQKYPLNYILWALHCYNDISNLLKLHEPDHIVIEETSKGSKNNYSQKILEWIHHLVAEHMCQSDFTATYNYFYTEEWRRICGCIMNDEEKRQNKNIREQRKLGVKVVKNLEGKRIGKITKKHTNVRRANEIFGLDLKLKNEDQADSLLLGYAYYLQNFKK